MAYPVACCFVSIFARSPSHEFLANILNAVEMDCRVKRKVVVNDKLVRVNCMKLRLGWERRTDLYIVSVVQIQLWAGELPISQNDVSGLAVRRSGFPCKIDLEEDVSR